MRSVLPVAVILAVAGGSEIEINPCCPLGQIYTLVGDNQTEVRLTPVILLYFTSLHSLEFSILIKWRGLRNFPRFIFLFYLFLGPQYNITI